MLISIIVPVYNCENTICRCIDSLLSQTFSSIEVLLIDDSSTDSSGRLCDKYGESDSRVHVLHNLTQGGVSNARNIGIENVTGDYVCFVDADDYVESEYIQNFVSGLQSGNELVFQGINIVRNGIIEKRIPIAGKYNGADILNGISDINKFSMFGYVCNKLYKTEIIKKNKLLFNTTINISEDRIFALQYLRFANSLVTIPKSAYIYEVHQGGLTNKLRSYNEIMRAAELNLNSALELLKIWDCPRFYRDTQRMFVITSYGAIRALFERSNNIDTQREYIKYHKTYKAWQDTYSPTDRMHKIIKSIISMPSSPLSYIMMKLYWYYKTCIKRIRS